MERLIIKDLISSASGYDNGDVIYKIIHTALLKKQKIVVSFAGIDAISSSFLNASILRLLEDISFDEIRENLIIVDSTKYINNLIIERFRFVLNKESNNQENASNE